MPTPGQSPQVLAIYRAIGIHIYETSIRRAMRREPTEHDIARRADNDFIQSGMQWRNNSMAELTALAQVALRAQTILPKSEEAARRFFREAVGREFFVSFLSQAASEPLHRFITSSQDGNREQFVMLLNTLIWIVLD